jgi:hypothetical protein
LALSGDIDALIRRCNRIGDEISDPSGFVPIRNLLSLFNAELRVRPLLVEGMLASVQAEATISKTQWLVLVDSDRYQIDDNAIAAESSVKPLPARFRFTVAHELTHTLAFGGAGTTNSLTSRLPKDATPAENVEIIEKETDLLTSLLLCPEASLEERLRSLREPPQIEFFLHLRQRYGVSREALINRLSVSRLTNKSDLWQRPELSGFALLLVDTSMATPELVSWPEVSNFSKGLVPSVVLNLRRKKRVSVKDAFQVEPGTIGNHASELTFKDFAGTPETPLAEEMKIEVFFERTSVKKGSKSFVLLRDQKAKDRVEAFNRLRSEAKAVRRFSPNL